MHCLTQRLHCSPYLHLQQDGKYLPNPAKSRKWKKLHCTTLTTTYFNTFYLHLPLARTTLLQLHPIHLKQVASVHLACCIWHKVVLSLSIRHFMLCGSLLCRIFKLLINVRVHYACLFYEITVTMICYSIMSAY